MKKDNANRKWFATVRWSAEDIQNLRPNWSIKQCKNWLLENQQFIEDDMINRGWNSITDLLPSCCRNESITNQ